MNNTDRNNKLIKKGELKQSQEALEFTLILNRSCLKSLSYHATRATESLKELEQAMSQFQKSWSNLEEPSLELE